MSIALPSGVTRLEKAVESAKGDNIVMVGSRGDRGNNGECVYPADYDEVISIFSLTSFGKRAESTEANAQYFYTARMSVSQLSRPTLNHRSMPLAAP